MGWWMMLLDPHHTYSYHHRTCIPHTYLLAVELVQVAGKDAQALHRFVVAMEPKPSIGWVVVLGVEVTELVKGQPRDFSGITPAVMAAKRSV